MPGSRKGADLARDGRFTLHSASVNPPEDPVGVARCREDRRPGVADGVLSGDQRGAGFRGDIGEVVRARVAGDELVIEVWQPGHALRRFTRRRGHRGWS